MVTRKKLAEEFVPGDWLGNDRYRIQVIKKRLVEGDLVELRAKDQWSGELHTFHVSIGVELTEYLGG